MHTTESQMSVRDATTHEECEMIARALDFYVTALEQMRTHYGQDTDTGNARQMSARLAHAFRTINTGRVSCRCCARETDGSSICSTCRHEGKRYGWD